MMQKLFEEKEETGSYKPEHLEEYFRTKFAYEEEIKQARESMRDALKDLVDKYNLPKKEIAIAEQIRKKDADVDLIMDIVSEFEIDSEEE